MPRNRKELFMSKIIKFVGEITFTIGGIFLVFSGIILNSFELTNEVVSSISLLITVSFGLVSVGLGVYSIGLAKDSDEKMKANSEHSLVEKISTMYENINNIEGLKVNGIRVFPSSTPDEKTISNDELKKIISDLDSAFKIIDYVSNETKNKFFNAFIRLSDVIQTQIKAFKNEDIKDYLRIIKLLKEYQFEDGEKALDNLKKKWNNQ